MSAYLGQVMMVGFNFAPRGWALCDGQLLPINQNQALFSLLGTTYGGDGRTTFALPDLRGRLVAGVGSLDGTNIAQGERLGSETRTLNLIHLPSHTHDLGVDESPATDAAPTNARLAMADAAAYGTGGAPVALGAATSSVGSAQPLDNMAPYTTVNFIIALEGFFPPRN